MNKRIMIGGILCLFFIGGCGYLLNERIKLDREENRIAELKHQTAEKSFVGEPTSFGGFIDSCKGLLEAIQVTGDSTILQLAKSEQDQLWLMGCLLSSNNPESFDGFGIREGMSWKSSSWIGFRGTFFDQITIRLRCYYLATAIFYGNFDFCDNIEIERGKGGWENVIQTDTKVRDINDEIGEYYRLWFMKIVEMGLDSARARNIYPLARTDYRWWQNGEGV